MKVLYAILFFISLTQDGYSLVYESYEMAATPTPFGNELTSTFERDGFRSLASLQHGIPSLGINQVFFKSEKQFVLMKYNIQGAVEINKIISTPKGFIVHKNDGDKIYMLYFRGFDLSSVQMLLNRMGTKVSHFRFLRSLLVSEAFASDCSTSFGQPILNQSSDLVSISASAAWESLKACMTGVGNGVFDSTVGVAQGISSQLASFLTHPIDYVEKVADTVELFLVKTAKFIKGLVTNPEETFNKIGIGLGKAWDDVKNTVSSMSTEMKINFVCSFIGSIGVDAAIAFFTGGAASEKIIFTINNLSRKFGMVGKMMSTLGKLSSQVLARLKLSGPKLEKFMNGLFNNHIPEQDLRHLDEIAHLNDELSLRTLSCYIR
jgi:hypothetical protein